MKKPTLATDAKRQHISRKVPQSLAAAVVLVLSQQQATAQLSTTNFENRQTQNAQNTAIDEHNLVVRPNNLHEMRLGIETVKGTFGSFPGTWACMGYSNIYSQINGQGDFVPPAASNMFGFLASDRSDRAFFGLRAQLDKDGRELNDRSDAIIAWGDNDGFEPQAGPDKLIISFFDYVNSRSNRNNYQGFDMAVYTPQGNYGLGTMNPTHQMHTTGSVRFEGLTSGPVTDLVGIDANGVLYRTQGGGGSNNCASVNYVPKTISASGALGCSQIYDNGTSVGIGSTGPFSYTWTGGLVGTTPPPASGTLRLDINGVSRALAYFATSDKRFKTDIRPVENAMDIVSQLNPVRYNWTKEKIGNYEFNSMPQIGFIAQEVEQVMPEAVIKDENGYYSMNYIEIVPVLTKALKEQQKMIDDLAAEVARLKKGTTAAGSEQKSHIYQNYPNPHSGRTSIRYEVREAFTKGGIYITDLNGSILQSQPIGRETTGEISFDMTGMKPGVYLYLLILDGKEIETKKMTLLAAN